MSSTERLNRERPIMRRGASRRNITPGDNVVKLSGWLHCVREMIAGLAPYNKCEWVGSDHMAQCVQESGLQIPAIETEDCLCQIGRNMLGTDPLMRVSNAVEFQRRNRTFSRIPLVTIARKPYILIAIIDTLMLPIGNTVRIRAASER